MCDECNVNIPEIMYRIFTAETEEPEICLCPNCTIKGIAEGTLNIPEGEFTSEISGASGAVRINCGADDSEVYYVTPDEALRLLGHGLMPNEFHKLDETHHGDYQIHDDYYEEETGAALQPVLGMDYISGIEAYTDGSGISDYEKEALKDMTRELVEEVTLEKEAMSWGLTVEEYRKRIEGMNEETDREGGIDG